MRVRAGSHPSTVRPRTYSDRRGLRAATRAVCPGEPRRHRGDRRPPDAKQRAGCTRDQTGAAGGGRGRAKGVETGPRCRDAARCLSPSGAAGRRKVAARGERRGGAGEGAGGALRGALQHNDTEGQGTQTPKSLRTPAFGIVQAHVRWIQMRSRAIRANRRPFVSRRAVRPSDHREVVGSHGDDHEIRRALRVRSPADGTILNTSASMSCAERRCTSPTRGMRS
jgi:hypothetical protein